MMQAFTTLSIVIPVLTGVLALVVFFFPEIQPKKGEPPPPASADLVRLQFHKNISFRNYLALINEGPGTLTEKELARRVAFVQFRVTTKGLEGEPLRLRREVLQEGSSAQLVESQDITITPEDQEESFGWHERAYLPRRKGKFKMHISLHREGEVASLADLWTPPFPGLGSR